jgi:hypothetical protein
VKDCSRNQTGNTALNVTLLSGIAIEATEPAVDMGCHLTPDSEPHIVGRRGVWSREHRVACWTSTAGSAVCTKKRTGTLSDEDSVRTVPVHSVVRDLRGRGLSHVHAIGSVATDVVSHDSSVGAAEHRDPLCPVPGNDVRTGDSVS